MEKEYYGINEEKSDFVVGIITIAIILGLFVWMLISVSVKSKSFAGAITADGEIRRGSEQVFTYTLDKNVKGGEKVVWTVDGQQVAEGSYVKGEPITLNYAPEKSGTLTVKAQVGKYSQTSTVEVLAPRLTVVAPNVTVTYGDNLPEMRAKVSGLLECDDTDGFQFDNLCLADVQNPDVGVYQIGICNECNYLDYETDYVYGTLTVLPKQLVVSNRFEKVYDGTNVIETPQLRLSGALKGDKVDAKADKLYFDNKNVGEHKAIMLANVELVGEDARNYVLTEYAYGAVLPKKVDVVGLSVKDKTFDGTTKATIDKMGTLSNVCAGDSVAIGSLDVSFSDANVGEHEIVTGDVTLVGADKDNYVVDKVQSGRANIRKSIWNKLFDKEPVAQGAN